MPNQHAPALKDGGRNRVETFGGVVAHDIAAEEDGGGEVGEHDDEPLDAELVRGRGRVGLGLGPGFSGSSFLTHEFELLPGPG